MLQQVLEVSFKVSLLDYNCEFYHFKLRARVVKYPRWIRSAQ